MNPAHKPILAAALVFIAVMGAFTIQDLIDNGPTALGTVSIIILAMFSFGIVGALRQPPDP